MWAGGDVNPVNDNLADDSRRNVSKNFNTLRGQPSPCRCIRKITLPPSTLPLPSIAQSSSVFVPVLSLLLPISGDWELFLFPQRLFNSVHALFPPFLLLQWFPSLFIFHCLLLIPCLQFIFLNNFPFSSPFFQTSPLSLSPQISLKVLSSPTADQIGMPFPPTSSLSIWPASLC